MSDRLLLDYGNMLAPRLGGKGLDPAELRSAGEAMRRAHAEVSRLRSEGHLGFWNLPFETDVVNEIRTFADGVGQAFDTVVVLGIGGSALGARALAGALRSPFWNELDDEAREYFPRLYVLDNVDPTTLGPLLGRLDLRRTLFNVVSKSGTTTETMAQFLIVREKLGQLLEGDRYRGHLLFTTDPDRGALREVANAEGIATLPIPPDVGGRFSVLSAVGLLPAALIGIDIEALLAGARAMEERCRSDHMEENPGALFAALQWLAYSRGAPIHVMMAYSDRLFGVADWFRQLWAESLGKQFALDGTELFVGPTPVSALGATDQHSQVQLYVEGPFDKTTTFLTLGEWPQDVLIPQLASTFPAGNYLGGHTLGELLHAEQTATREALTRHGRMNMTLQLPRLHERHLGELIMMLEVATVYAGALFGINPLDQPGVELGKVITYGLLGREGFAAEETAPIEEQWVCG